jgi:hypothetical protein
MWWLGPHARLLTVAPPSPCLLLPLRRHAGDCPRLAFISTSWLHRPRHTAASRTLRWLCAYDLGHDDGIGRALLPTSEAPILYNPQETLLWYAHGLGMPPHLTWVPVCAPHSVCSCWAHHHALQVDSYLCQSTPQRPNLAPQYLPSRALLGELYMVCTYNTQLLKPITSRPVCCTLCTPNQPAFRPSACPLTRLRLPDPVQVSNASSIVSSSDAIEFGRHPVTSQREQASHAILQAALRTCSDVPWRTPVIPSAAC